MDVGLALVVVTLEGAAFWYWAAWHGLSRWAVPSRGKADAVLVFVAGPILLVGAAVGFFVVGMVISCIAEILVAVALIGLVTFGTMTGQRL
jgi:hypothetical protein